MRNANTRTHQACLKRKASHSLVEDCPLSLAHIPSNTDVPLLAPESWKWTMTPWNLFSSTLSTSMMLQGEKPKQLLLPAFTS